MFKTLFAAAVLAVVGLACSPCARISNAEASADEKGKACNISRNNTFSVSTCESKLSACSGDDSKKLDEYANCLNGLPTCQSSTSLSWGLQRATCASALSGISVNCLSAFN